MYGRAITPDLERNFRPNKLTSYKKQKGPYSYN